MADAQQNIKDKIIGIDAGSAAIKIACAERKDGGMRVSKIAFRQVIGNESTGVEASAALIKELIDENQMTGDSAFFVLNGPQCVIRVMSFPKMNDDLLDKTVKSEIKKELNLVIDDYKIDFKTCREFEVKSEEGINQKKIEVIVSIVDNKVISRYSQMAQLAGLKCVGFIPAAIGLFSYSKNSALLSGLADNEVLMFLDFGNSQMGVNFIGQNGLRFSKEINMGGSALTTVVKTMHSDETLTMEASEEKKFKIGLMNQEAVDSLEDSSPNANLHKVLNLSFKKLFQRIRLSTGYYFAHFRDSTLSSQVMKKIVLHGGNSEIPGIASFFDDAFEAVVTKADSWSACDNGECNLSLCEEYNLSFMNLCSAFCEYFMPEYNLNFSNERAVAPKSGSKADNEAKFNDFIASNAPGLQGISKYKFVNVAVSIFCLYLIALTSISAYDILNILSFNSQKKELEARYNELNSSAAAAERKNIERQYSVFNKKKNAKEVIEFKKYNIDRALASISGQLPENTIISSMSFINDIKPVLVLNGTAAEYGRVIKFSDELKKNQAFSKVNLKRSEQKAKAVEFQFDCEFNNEKKN
jgi:Tfp pilus assembly PilM family ATPase